MNTQGAEVGVRQTCYDSNKISFCHSGVAPVQRRLKRVAVTAVIMMYLVLVSGALVTNTGSGQGCGNRWPLCDTEHWDAAAIIEFFSHRGVTALATIAVLALCYFAWRHLTPRPIIRQLVWISIGFLVLQALLGAGNVMWPQPKLLLALHFGISLVSYASVLLLAVFTFREAAGNGTRLPDVSVSLRRAVWVATGFVFVTVYLGAYVRHTGAGLACVGWPLCNGQLVPTGGPALVNFLHRLAAAIGLVLVVQVTVLASKLQGRPDVQRAAWVVLALYGAQVLSGALLPTGFYAIWSQMLHSSILVAMFGVMSYLSLIVLPADTPTLIPDGNGKVSAPPLTSSAD